MSFIWLLDAEGLMLTVVTAAVLHELGHLTAIKLFGAGIGSFRLSAVGAELEVTGGERLSYLQDILICFGGPLVNLLLAFTSAYLAEHLGNEGLSVFAGVNLILGLFNLLPAAQLDGGNIARLLSMYFFDRETVALRVLHYAVCAGLILLGVYSFAYASCNFSLLLTSVWLLLRAPKY
ncbi:MAG: site-2 protease family protein [Oscillospiraceae bacterium]|nr:site-2 protease family protein [Oscillospiraceae bacterium]